MSPKCVAALGFAAASLVCLVQARADQCAGLSKAQATKAAQLVRSASTIVHYCEPCGEEGKKRAEQVERVRIEPLAGGQSWQVLVNDVAVDFAYVYVKKGKRFQNAAVIISCATDGVSPWIAFP